MTPVMSLNVPITLGFPERWLCGFPPEGVPLDHPQVPQRGYWVEFIARIRFASRGLWLVARVRLELTIFGL